MFRNSFALVALTSALIGSTAAHASIYSGPGGSFTDALDNPGVSIFTINVADVGTVGTFNGLILTNLAHTWIGDLQITLTLPDATTVSIIDRVGFPTQLFGDNSNLLGNYTFGDGGADIWANATDPFHGTNFVLPSGTYAATGAGSGAPINLNALLAGKSIAGVWTLTVTDFESGDVGSLGSWSIDVGVIPAPGVLGAFVIALALRGRRRHS